MELPVPESVIELTLELVSLVESSYVANTGIDKDPNNNVIVNIEINAFCIGFINLIFKYFQINIVFCHL